jgi:exosortase
MSISEPAVGAPAEAVAPARAFDWRAVVASPVFRLSLLTLGALCYAFWPLILQLKKLWLDMDSYYAHGLLVPFCAGYLVWDKWDKIKAIPVKPFFWAVVPLAGVLYIAHYASLSWMFLLLSLLIVASISLSVLFVAGWRWMAATLPATGFLMLGMPVFDRLIDRVTMPLQIKSTTIAFHLLNLLGFDPIRTQPTILYVDAYALQVAAACSGLKTTIAITAAVVFFMLISQLRWWANLVLAVIAIPLSLVVNGIRIAMIAIVGANNGADAAMKFHDYSGYIALALCFVVLGLITKRLEKWSR